MELSYKKLWKMLIERDMKKVDLMVSTGIAPNTMTKLRKNQPVSMDILWKICLVLGCNIGDIVEFDLSRVDQF